MYSEISNSVYEVKIKTHLDELECTSPNPVVRYIIKITALFQNLPVLYEVNYLRKMVKYSSILCKKYIKNT